MTRLCIYSWVRNLDQFFERADLSVLTFDRLPIHDDLAKPWTEMQLMGFEDLIETTFIPAASDDPSVKPTAEEWRNMYKDAEKATTQGMSIRMDMIICAGRKAP